MGRESFFCSHKEAFGRFSLIPGKYAGTSKTGPTLECEPKSAPLLDDPPDVQIPHAAYGCGARNRGVVRFAAGVTIRQHIRSVEAAWHSEYLADRSVLSRL